MLIVTDFIKEINKYKRFRIHTQEAAICWYPQNGSFILIDCCTYLSHIQGFVPHLVCLHLPGLSMLLSFHLKKCSCFTKGQAILQINVFIYGFSLAKDNWCKLVSICLVTSTPPNQGCKRQPNCYPRHLAFGQSEDTSAGTHLPGQQVCIKKGDGPWIPEQQLIAVEGSPFCCFWNLWGNHRTCFSGTANPITTGQVQGKCILAPAATSSGEQTHFICPAGSQVGWGGVWWTHTEAPNWKWKGCCFCTSVVAQMPTDVL